LLLLLVRLRSLLNKLLDPTTMQPPDGSDGFYQTHADGGFWQAIGADEGGEREVRPLV
jgi:hypothetical protein